MSKLLHNLPIEHLTPENDYLGIIETADLIKDFLEHNKDELKEIKMFSLYGEWGSGKSTLMKYLKKEMNADFRCFFFEAWEFESTDNLPLSLLEYLTEETESITDELCKEIIEVSTQLLKGFTKAVTIKTPIINFNGKEFVQAFEEKKPDSFYKLKKDFKTKFLQWEGAASRESQYNLIFIDDLDRCEPENVLNLLSALKLFFTNGARTVFFCGIDKKAVQQAVQTKYGDVVKSNEYLEKIFDISFTMPTKFDLEKLCEEYFDPKIIINLNGKEKTLARRLSNFLEAIHFTNPRKVKKVLNRFTIISSMLSNQKNKESPRVLQNEGICLFDALFLLYFIILKEFHANKIGDIKNHNLRSLNYNKAVLESKVNVGSTEQLNLFDKIQQLSIKSNLTENFNQLKNEISPANSNKSRILSQFTFCISPINVISITLDSFSDGSKFYDFFKPENKEIDYRFAHFIIGNLELLLSQNIESAISVSEILNLVIEYP